MVGKGHGRLPLSEFDKVSQPVGTSEETGDFKCCLLSRIFRWLPVHHVAQYPQPKITSPTGRVAMGPYVVLGAHSGGELEALDVAG